MRRATEPRYQENPPNPGATVESLRAIGYDLSMAIADVIDNSVSAGASSVRIMAAWGGASTTIAIVDDGNGLTDAEVFTAMRLGSSDASEDREAGDLGRFGFGLKTASFSQGRELTVVSHKSARARAVASWDLDHLRNTSSWQLRRDLPEGIGEVLRGFWPTNPNKGTAVIWRRLDRLIPNATGEDDVAARHRFHAGLRLLDSDLGVVFHRLISSKRLAVSINGSPVAAWDPFADAEQLSKVRRRVGQSDVDISAWLAPRRAKDGRDLPPPPGGWSRRQGIYVYRCDRLISAGGWLNTGERVSDRYDRARIAVSIGNELDHLWHLDVKKSTVEIPDSILDEVAAIAKVCRRRATEREGLATSRADRPAKRGVKPMWSVAMSRGVATLQLDRRHPIFELLRTSVGEDFVEGLLRSIEDSLPIDYVPHRPSPRPLRNEPLPDALAWLGHQLFEARIELGVERSRAAEIVASEHPYNQYPDTVDRLLAGGTT
jgi:Histidine kinase-, DNA gyrase B-, and HSP90-like ATPase